MIASDNERGFELSRRKLLEAAGVTAVAAALIGTGAAEAELPVRRSPNPVTAPPVHGLHLQFGADASSEVVVSWHTLQPVRRPRVVLGHLDGKLDRTSVAVETSYTDAKSGRPVYAYHARLRGLQPAAAYLYVALHDGAEPEFGTFHTAPRGRMPLTFTSFGDQGTPTLGKKYVPPAGVTIANAPFVNDNLGSPAASDTTPRMPAQPTIATCCHGGVGSRTCRSLLSRRDREVAGITHAKRTKITVARITIVLTNTPVSDSRFHACRILGSCRPMTIKTNPLRRNVIVSQNA